MCKCLGVAIALVASTTVGVLIGCGERDAAASEQAEQISQPAPAAATVPPGVRPALREADFGNPVHVTYGFVLGGQPDPSEFEDMIREAGIRTVLDLRMEDESRGFDEALTVIDRGLEYLYLGFTPPTLNDELLDIALGHMRDEGKQPMLVHSKDGSRVGAVWLAFRILEDGFSEAAALAEAKTVGLKGTVMEEKVLEYARKKKGG